MTAPSSSSVRLWGPRDEVEYQVRRVLANELADLITMDAADLVENAVALTDAVMKLLTDWEATGGEPAATSAPPPAYTNCGRCRGTGVPGGWQGRCPQCKGGPA